MKAHKVANQKLLDYVDGALSKGFGKEAIIKKLKDSGYSEAQIKEAFDDIKGNKKNQYRQKKARNPLVLIIAIIVITVLLVFITIQVIEYKKSTDPNLKLNIKLIDLISADMKTEDLISSETESIKGFLWNKEKYSTSIDCKDYLMLETTDEAEAIRLCDTMTYAYSSYVENPDNASSINFPYFVGLFEFSDVAARDMLYRSFLKAFSFSDTLNPDIVYEKRVINGYEVEIWKKTIQDSGQSIDRYVILIQMGDGRLVELIFNSDNIENQLGPIQEILSE